MLNARTWHQPVRDLPSHRHRRGDLLTGGENLVDLRQTDRFEQRLEPAARITPRLRKTQEWVSEIARPD